MKCACCSCDLVETEKLYCEDCFDDKEDGGDYFGNGESYPLEAFHEALQSLRARRIVAFLDDLERALPGEFVGLADDIIKWAGKTR